MLLLISTFASASEPTFKAWKTFQSDYGFEFKYPDCWTVRSDDIDGSGPLSQHAGVFATEAENCITPRRRQWVDNGITFSPIKNKTTKLDIKQKADTIEKSAKYKIKNGTWVALKRFKINGDTEAIGHVEHQGFIRWNYEIYCDSRLITVSVTGMDNPSKEILNKIRQQDDLAIYEPYKTIIESFRCTTPKL